MCRGDRGLRTPPNDHFGNADIDPNRVLGAANRLGALKYQTHGMLLRAQENRWARVSPGLLFLTAALPCTDLRVDALLQANARFRALEQVFKTPSNSVGSSVR